MKSKFITLLLWNENFEDLNKNLLQLRQLNMLTNSCDWNFEEEQNSFARTGILKTGKQIKDLFHQHCDSWDWNFENFENNFDLVEVELFWLLSAKDFFSWSTCKSKKWKQVQ